MDETSTNRRFALSEELFQELHDLLDRLEGDPWNFQCAGAFVPRVGKLYGTGGIPRVMFIGKATHGWGGSSESLEADSLVTEEFYQTLYNKESRSLFWYFIRNLTEEIFSKIGLDHKNDMQWALDRVIWSNLMKIGSEKSQPYGALANEQRPLMKKILLHELDTQQPDIIILCTNDYENALSSEIFNLSESVPIAKVGGSEINTVILPKYGAKLYWTRHPQGWANRIEAERIIAEDFANWYR